MAIINISDGNSTFSLWTDNDSGLTLENLKSAYPDAINLINPVYEPRRLLSVRDGKIYNPDGWDTNIVYLAHLGSSRPPTPIVSRQGSSVDANRCQMNIIVVTGKEKKVKVLLDDVAKISEHTLRRAFQLENEVPIGLTIIIDEKEVCLDRQEFERGQFYFVLPKERENLEFRLTWDEQRRSRPRFSLDAHPESPYPKAPSPPPPMSKSIDKWMFYAVDSAGKSTVVCIHPRYFVTFRHGTHLQLQVGSVIRIFNAKSETNEQDGYEVTVVDLNERLDFILLRSKEIIVPIAPRLAIAEESENFLLAGFGDQSTGEQQLAYLNGIVHSVRGYYFSVYDRPAHRPSLLMGPFILGTGQSSRGGSGGACWSFNRLIGINFGVTTMPETTHSLSISEAATFSPKNIISPAIPFISMSLMAQLYIEKQTSPKPPPKKKRKPLQTEIEGIGTGSLTIDLDES
uniref:Uncharacterized protein n=1 Tax=Acrobeloides nanus TaxID=290746 RepID=A0A914EN09_9BILA